MRWFFCQDCHIDGCCENQDRGNKCEVYAKKITEKCEKLEKQLKIAVDALRKYADEPEYYHDAVKALEQIKELDK